MAASLNAFYGHNRILARFVGLPRPRPIFGYLLHGWHPWFPWMPDVAVIRASVKGRLPVIAWSERDVAVLKAGGVRNVTAIGSPFLYLLAMQGTPPLPEGRSLLTFPFHTIASSVFEDTWAEYAEYLESLEYDRVTVCLYPNDFENPGARRTFEAKGFRVVTNGTARDPAFLYNLYDLVAEHSAVTSNRISTGLVYGTAMGREGFLGGRVPAVLQQQDAGYIAGEGERTERFQRERFPELIEGVPSSEAEAYGRGLLGADSLMEAEQLKHTLGWSGPRRIAARALAGAAGARRKLGMAPELTAPAPAPRR